MLRPNFTPAAGGRRSGQGTLADQASLQLRHALIIFHIARPVGVLIASVKSRKP
jgi:hypothetical protein